MIFEDCNNENLPVQNFLHREGNSQVKNVLKDMAIDVDADTLSKNVLQAFEKLINEREHWRREALNFSQEATRLHSCSESFRTEKELQENIIESLRREQQSVNNRISTMLMEQREVKNHWLAEKADLQSRLCQVQALNTQIQGTLKKKEKEFDRLQIQLSKVVKDAARNSKATLFISAPLKKAMSQDNTSSSTQLLRDPEIIALKNSMLHMERENIGLRSTVENMQGDLTDLQESFDKAIKAAEEKYRIQLESVKQERIVNTKFIENVQKNTIVEEEESVAEEDVLVELVASAVPTPAATPLPAKSCSLTITVPSPHTPCSEPASLQGLKTPGTIAKKYLEGTPGARPVSWIVQQANTEVKRLRERADNVAVGNGFSSDLVSIGGSYSMDAMMKINALRARLSEALVVIQEQDRLIHDALLGRLPNVAEEGIIQWEVDEAEDEVLASLSSKSNNNSIDIDELLNMKDSDLLPPASPETLQLMQTFGWSVPRIPSESARQSFGEVNAKPEQLEF